jgi:hypothetical protein
MQKKGHKIISKNFYVRFFGASKEMNEQFLKSFGFRPSPE